MAALRCSTCDTDWPRSSVFVGPKAVDMSRCPVCGSKLFHDPEAYAISRKEATAIILAHEFELFYEEWDAKRTGPTPEAKGAQEAREIIELKRQFDAGDGPDL